MAADAAGIGLGDEVLVASMTFAASSNCVLYVGGTPVFVDVNEETLNIDLIDLERKITPKTKAIIPVDFTGQSVDIDAIMKLANKYNLIVIEDAAHALGATYKGEPVGRKAHMTMFSFHPVKPITTGEGGIIVTNDEKLYKRMMMFRTHGITKNKEDLFDYHGMWYYEQQFLGYNYRLTDIQAALGLSQLKKLDKFIRKRRNIAKIYNENLKNTPGLKLPKEADFSNSGWHLYIVQIDFKKLKLDKKEFFEKLHELNVGIWLHYIPVYLHPYYKELGYKKGICPNAENVYSQMISLPIFPQLSLRVIVKITSIIRNLLESN
jgi:dTDP-4-amino-4,6-dideoxygalactose transaminase